MRKNKLLLCLTASLLLAGAGVGICYALPLENTKVEQEQPQPDVPDTPVTPDVPVSPNDPETPGDNTGEEETKYFTALCYVGEEVVSTTMVEKGLSLAELPQSTNSYLIKGWKLSDGTAVDPLTYPITADVNFYAEIETRYKVSFSVPTLATNGMTSDGVGSIYLAVSEGLPSNSDFSSKFIDNYSTWNFAGYLDRKNKELNPGDTWEYYSNFSSQTMNFRFTKHVTATFKLDNTIYTSQDRTLDTKKDTTFKAKIDTATLETPTKEGYTFKGWAIEGAEDTIIDFTTYTFQDNVTFVAVFEEVEQAVQITGFEFSGGSVCAYTGSDTDVVIPASYSRLADGTIVEGDDIVITKLCEGIFYNSNVESVVVPDSVTSVECGVFDNATKLKSVTLGTGIKDIPEYFFQECVSLENVVIHGAVTRIATLAFSNCSSLTNIDFLPNTVITIEDLAFKGCIGLTNIRLKDSVTSFASFTFDDCDNVTEIIIGDGIEIIPEYAFNHMSSLETITFGAGLKEFQANAMPYTTLIVNYVGTEDEWNKTGWRSQDAFDDELYDVVFNFNYVIQ